MERKKCKWIGLEQLEDIDLSTLTQTLYFINLQRCGKRTVLIFCLSVTSLTKRICGFYRFNGGQLLTQQKTIVKKAYLSQIRRSLLYVWKLLRELSDYKIYQIKLLSFNLCWNQIKFGLLSSFTRSGSRSTKVSSRLQMSVLD